jgi:hypothetical protein
MPKRIPISVSHDEPPFVVARAFCPRTGSEVSANLIVDTGAFDLLLSMDTATKLGADRSDLVPSRLMVQGVGGRISPSEMQDVALVFECEGRQTWDVFMHRVKVMTDQGHRQAKSGSTPAPNLLGRAFMEEHRMVLHWDFGTRIAYIELP